MRNYVRHMRPETFKRARRLAGANEYIVTPARKYGPKLFI
jgi:hypothetical protein